MAVVGTAVAGFFLGRAHRVPQQTLEDRLAMAAYMGLKHVCGSTSATLPPYLHRHVAPHVA